MFYSIQDKIICDTDYDGYIFKTDKVKEVLTQKTMNIYNSIIAPVYHGSIHKTKSLSRIALIMSQSI